MAGRAYKFIFASGVAVLLGLMYAPEVRPQDKNLLAVIGEKAITVEDFRSEMQKLGRGLPGSFTWPEQREELLTALVRSEMTHKAALQEGFDRKPAVVELIKRMIIAQYKKEKLEPEFERISVADEEIRAYYDIHSSEVSTPEMVRAAIIQIAISKKASDDEKQLLFKRAESAREEALKLGPETLSFGGIAVKYSDDQVSRYRGGDTGLLVRAEAGSSRWGKPVMDAIFALKTPGEVSQVINSDGGFYIVKLMESRQSVSRPFQEVKEMLKNRLLFEKRSRVEKAFYDSLAATVKVKIDGDLLKTVGPPDGGKRPEPPPLPGK